MTSAYLFDNSGVQAAGRFENTAPLYDPRTIQLMEECGIDVGWNCLEVGGGGGSIAAWMANRVGPDGRVLTTDLDPRHLELLNGLNLPNLEVQKHDVGNDPLPENAYDLVHSRLVIMHVPEREEAVRRMAASLKPGGWLIVEDFDAHLVNRGYGTRSEEGAALHEKVRSAMGRLMAQRGGSATGTGVGWARTLYGRLRDLGFVDVQMVGHLAMWQGGSVGAQLDRVNFDQMRAEALAAKLLTSDEIDEILQLLNDPNFEISSPLMFTAWGRKPGSAT